MPVTFAWVAPHGDEIIEELNPSMNPSEKRLSDAMKQSALQLFERNPDVIVLATPHNLRILNHIGIITTQYTEGTLSNDKKTISLKLTCERTFANKLYELAAKENLHVVAVNYGTSEGEASSMCMDWGTFIPLWFVKKVYDKQNKEMPPVVLITPSREIPWSHLVRLGELIVDLSNVLKKNTAFIASADQGHAHDPKGPYGFDEASEKYDTFVQELIKEDKLEKLLELESDFLEKAKPDSFWQMLILLGVINKETSLKHDLMVYECPSYFGMLVATFHK